MEFKHANTNDGLAWRQPLGSWQAVVQQFQQNVLNAQKKSR